MKLLRCPLQKDRCSPNEPCEGAEKGSQKLVGVANNQQIVNRIDLPLIDVLNSTPVKILWRMT